MNPVAIQCGSCYPQKGTIMLKHKINAKALLSIILGLIFIINIIPISAFADSAEAVYTTPIEEPPVYASSKAELQELEAVVDIDELKAYLFEQFKSCPKYIDVSAFNIPNNSDNADALKQLIWEELPIAFHVRGLGTSGLSDITVISATYYYSSDEYLDMYSECVEAADRILAGIKNNEGLSDTEKALLIHDRLALACEYDFNNTDNMYDLYGALVNGIAVCQGYAEAYDYLLEQVGIDSFICSSEQLNHAWNIIYINNKPYHVDVTWDDYAWQNGARGAVGIVGHENFLRSSDGIYAAGHEADDYDTSPSDTTYDSYFWQNSDTAFQLIDGEIYYIDNVNATLNRYSDNKALCDVSDMWEFSYGHWGNHARLSADGTNLFYSLSDAVYKYDLTSNASEKVFEPSLANWNCIYGFAFADGYLICDINDTPPYSEYGIDNLYQIRALYDEISPSASLSSSNDCAPSQTVTLVLSDNVGLAGYYWGTDGTYTNNSFISVSSDNGSAAVTETVSTPGTYYLAVKDTSGNVSEKYSLSFCKTTLDANGGGVSPSYIITQSGSSIALPIPTRDRYNFIGWGTSADSASGVTSIMPSGDETYYAIWEELSEIPTDVRISYLPVKTTYYIGESLDTSGLALELTYTDGSVETVTSGFTVSGFDSSAVGTKTVTVSYGGKTASFDVTVSDGADIPNIPGDINGDGRVDSKDLTRLMKKLSGQDVVTYGPDVTYDGIVDTKDLTRLMKMLSGQ